MHIDKRAGVIYNICMILTDIHTHSTFSADGDSSLTEMAEAARDMGVRYFGVSEHFDYDYSPAGLTYEGGKPAATDEDGYFYEVRRLQRELNCRTFMLLAGCEFGYTDNVTAQKKYAAVIEKYTPDFVVNSVHTCDGADCWFGEYFNGKSKEYAYSRYLERVLKSLSAPYRYDIVAHLGYVSRHAPYDDPAIRYSDFSQLYDEILNQIIARGKILEVNSSVAGAGGDFLPAYDVLERYFELGGRKISFASDAHFVSRICNGRDKVVAALKSIGFNGITVPFQGEEIEVKI